MNALKVDDLEVYIGPFYIVQGVSFEVPITECVVMLGRNGAGKTTTLKSIIGLIPPKNGSIKIFNKEVSGLPPYQIAKMGIGYVPDVRRIFPNLTVEENLRLAMIKAKEENENDRLELVYNIFPDLKRHRKLKSKALSGGQQQMLNIARGIAPSNNKLLLIDEPTEGLSPIFVQKIIKAFERLKQQRLSILLVESKLDLVKRIAEKYVIMSDGKVVDSGDVDDLLKNKEIIKRHLGVYVF